MGKRTFLLDPEPGNLFTSDSNKIHQPGILTCNLLFPLGLADLQCIKGDANKSEAKWMTKRFAKGRKAVSFTRSPEIMKY